MPGCTLLDDDMDCPCRRNARSSETCAYSYPETRLTQAENAVLNETYTSARRAYADALLSAAA